MPSIIRKTKHGKNRALKRLRKDPNRTNVKVASTVKRKGATRYRITWKNK